MKKTTLIIAMIILIITIFFKFNNISKEILPENFKVFVKKDKTHMKLCTLNKKDEKFKKIISVINDNKYFWTLTFATYAPNVLLVSDETSINIFRNFWIVSYNHKYYGKIKIKKKINKVIENICK